MTSSFKVTVAGGNGSVVNATCELYASGWFIVADSPLLAPLPINPSDVDSILAGALYLKAGKNPLTVQPCPMSTGLKRHGHYIR